MIRFNGKIGEWEIDSAEGWQAIDRLDALRYMEQDAEGRIGHYEVKEG